MGPSLEDFEPISIQNTEKQLKSLQELIVLNQEQRRNFPKNPEKYYLQHCPVFVYVYLDF